MKIYKQKNIQKQIMLWKATTVIYIGNKECTVLNYSTKQF